MSMSTPPPAGGTGGTNAGAKSGSVAHVNFRVRCETLGYGEEIFLIQDGDDKMQKVSKMLVVAVAVVVVGRN